MESTSISGESNDDEINLSQTNGQSEKSHFPLDSQMRNNGGNAEDPSSVKISDSVGTQNDSAEKTSDEISNMSFVNSFQSVESSDNAHSSGLTSDQIRDKEVEKLENDGKSADVPDTKATKFPPLATENQSVSETSKADQQNNQNISSTVNDFPNRPEHIAPAHTLPFHPSSFPKSFPHSVNLPPPGFIHQQPGDSQSDISNTGSSIVAPPQFNFNFPRPALPPPNVRPAQIPAPDVWVETQAADGKTYFYHAQTRQTQWTKPDNKVVITQEEFKKMVLTVSSTLGQLPLHPANSSAMNVPPNVSNGVMSHSSGPPTMTVPRFPPPLNQLPPPNMNVPPNMAPPGPFNAAAVPHQGAFPPPGAMGMPPPHDHQRPIMPPNFGLIPPGVSPSHGANMPPGNFAPPGAPPVQLPYPGMVQGGPRPPVLGTEWAENVTGEGKVYWYNVRTMQTTWTKPAQVEEAEKTQREQEELQRVEMERRRKEEQEKMEREAKEAEAKARAKPVASHPIPHSAWCVVFTGDNKVFYFNPSSKLSVWHRPEELRHNRDVDLILTNPPHKANKPAPPSAVVNLAVTANPNETGAAEGGATKTPTDNQDDEDESPAAKKRKTEEAAQKLDEARLANMRAAIPYETRQQQFLEMLAERNVSAFSTWEKELPKIVFDHRYSLLSAKDRKNVFDLFTRNKAEEERKERNNKIKEKKDQFRSLLEDSEINSRMTFTEWLARGWSKDARFKALEKNREREAMFDEFVSQLRQKEQQSTKTKLTNLKEQFFALLSEQSYLDETARWSKLRSVIEDDGRYKAVPSGSLREQWFQEYIDEVKRQLDPGELREAERRKRVEESMRARQQAVAEEREQNDRVITEQRLQHRREESLQRFKALLVDIIKDSEMTWKAARRLMKKDHRWSGGGLDDKDGSGVLSRDDKEQLFNEHMEQLVEKRRLQFREMLDQCDGISFTSMWREARRKVKEDPRFEKFSSSDRRREREFDSWKETAYMRAKHNFKELLKETRMITHKSHALVKHSEQHMHDIEEILKKDKRYLVLNSINQERRKMILNYLEDTSKRGPPPPPTASDPSLRRLPPLSSTASVASNMQNDYS